MADRGDVLSLRQQIGFGSSVGNGRAVVVQATPLNAALPTFLVVPLDVAGDVYAGADLLVPVSAREAGTNVPAVAIPTHLRFLSGDRFEPGRVGRLKPGTLAALEDKLRLILDL